MAHLFPADGLASLSITFLGLSAKANGEFAVVCLVLIVLLFILRPRRLG